MPRFCLPNLLFWSYDANMWATGNEDRVWSVQLLIHASKDLPVCDSAWHVNQSTRANDLVLIAQARCHTPVHIRKIAL